MQTEPLLVPDVLERAAHRFTDHPAVEDVGGDRRSFAQLWERSRYLAGGLLSLGLRPGDRVLEAVPNRCAALEVDQALAIAGLVRVPLNPRLGPRAWTAIARDSGASALILGEGLTTAPGTDIAAAVDVDRVIGVGGGSPGPRVDELVELCIEPPAMARDADALIGLAYSSGTTGRPKGAMRTHRMRLASARAMVDHVLPGAGPASLYLHAGPIIHTSGLFVLPFLELGGRQLLVDHPRPADVAALVRDRRVTHLAVVPTVLSALSHVEGLDPSWFESVEMLAYAGAPIRSEQLRTAAHRLTPRLLQYYGLVEAMPPLTVLDQADHHRALDGDPALDGSAGRILPHVQLEVIGDEGESTGEIAVRGEVVSPGYWQAAGRDDLAKAFDPDGRLLTGDVGRVENGYLRLTDRRHDVIISGGYNIFPSEVEHVVAAAHGVQDCAAVGLPDPTWGQRLVVAVTVAGAAPQDVSAAVRRAADDLPAHQRPKEIHVVETMPLGATGKIDRRALVDRFSETFDDEG